MSESNGVRRSVCGVLGMAALTLLLAGADDAKQTISAGGLKFEAPRSWKSSTPAGGFRVAQLKVEPLEGDGYPAEMVITVFRPGAGTVEANLKRWQGFFRDKDGNEPRIESKKVQGKNVEITRAETHGEYQPSTLPGRAPEPKRSDARFLGAIVPGDGATYYIRFVGPDKTMTRIKPEFDALLSSIQVASQ